MVNFVPLLDVFHVRLMGHLSIVLLVREHFDAGLFDRRVVVSPGPRRRYLLLHIQHLEVVQLLRTFGGCRRSLIGAGVHDGLVGGNLLAEHDPAGAVCPRFGNDEVAHLGLLLFLDQLHCLLGSLSLLLHVFLELALPLAVGGRAFAALTRKVEIQVYFHVGINLWTSRLNDLLELRSVILGVLRRIV